MAKEKYYMFVKGSSQNYNTLLDTGTAGTYNVNIPENSITRVVIVGGGGAAGMRGQYDDRGYGWGGGSGAVFSGEFELSGGVYSVTVGSANNNTKAQGGNTNTMNPDDTSTHDSFITGVVRVGGGKSGTTSGVGSGGSVAVFDVSPKKTFESLPGNSGSYNSGGKGSSAAAICNGGSSVYGGYGAGQGCATSEYAARRYWINGSGGYAKIQVIPLDVYNTPMKTYSTMTNNKNYVAVRRI